jgi:hypothetical protein
VLNASQSEAKALLEEHLRQSPVAVLQSLSGAGKSLVAGEIIKEQYPEGRAVDTAVLSMRIEEIQELVARSIRVIVLSSDESRSVAATKSLGVEAVPVIMRCMTPEEVEGWMDAITPVLEESERALMLEYGLGVPLLLEHLAEYRPVTRLSAQSQCTAYLQRMLKTYGCSPKNDHAELRAILAQYSDFAAPADALAPIVSRYSSWGKQTPMSVLGEALIQGNSLPIPQSPDIFRIYQEWLERVKDEPNFNLFVSDMPEAARFIDEIGYSDFSETRNPTLKRFVHAGARKGAAFYKGPYTGGFRAEVLNLDESSFSYLYEGATRVMRASGVAATLTLGDSFGREVPVLGTGDAPNPFVLHKHDHTHSVVMPVAYTVECWLQQAGIPYTISYNDVLFAYDPATRTYAPLTAEKVSYFEELYRERWAAEEAAEGMDDWNS